MKRKKLLKTLLIIIGLFAGILCLLQTALNSRYASSRLKALAAEYVEGGVDFSRLHFSLFRRFPSVSVEVKDFCIGLDRPDTLARFNSLKASLNPFSLLSGRINVPGLELKGLEGKLHAYPSGEYADNWSIFRFPSDTADTQEDTLFSLPRVRVARVKIDSLFLSYTAPGDTLSYDLSSLSLTARRSGKGRVALSSLGRWDSYQYGSLLLPVDIDGGFTLKSLRDSLLLDLDSLHCSLAYLPFRLDGQWGLSGRGNRFDMNLSVPSCPLDSMLRSYADHFNSLTADFRTTACLQTELSAKGWLTDSSIPELEACIRIPGSQTRYLPRSLDVDHEIDIDLKMDSSGVLDADVAAFSLSLDGLEANLEGRAFDLLGSDPRFRLSSSLSSDLSALIETFPELSPVRNSSGVLNASLRADTRSSELKDFRFLNSTIEGSLHSDGLNLCVDSDSLKVNLFRPDVIVTSNPQGFSICFAFDSLYFTKGHALTARARMMDNDACLTKVKLDSAYAPQLAVRSISERLFLRSGSYRFGLRGLDVSAEALQKVRRQKRARRIAPELLKEKDFEKADLDISLDSTLASTLDKWSLKAHAEVSSGFFASPRLPLRSRLSAFHADFMRNTLIVDTLAVSCGTSDLEMKGSVRGLKTSLVRKDRLIGDIDLKSDRLNVNELLSAWMLGQKDENEVSVQDENDESFVTDTLSDASVTVEHLPLIVVPGNLDMNVSLTINHIDYANVDIGPLTTGLKLKDRTAQLTKTSISAPFAKAGLDAFYSTKTKKDISAGVNLSLENVTARGVSAVIPQIDELMPELKHFDGRLSCSLSATSQLDTNMNVLIPTLEGVLRIKGDDLAVHQSASMGKLCDMLLFRRRESIPIDSLRADAVIHDSKLEIFPFELGTGRLKLALRGTQNFDKSMYYHLSVLRSPLLVRFGVNIYGSLDDVHFSLGRAKYREGHLPAFTRQLDTVQINLARSISNIFRSSVDEVMRYNAGAVGRIDRTSSLHKSELDREDSQDDQAREEYAQMYDALTYERELEDQTEQILKEVDLTLEETFPDMESLMKSYEDQIYDKKMIRRMERQKKKDQRKRTKEKANDSK